MRSTRKFGAVLVAAGLVVAACGGDDDDSADGGDDTEASEPGDDGADDVSGDADDDDGADDDDADDASDDDADDDDADDDADDGTDGADADADDDMASPADADDDVCTADNAGGVLRLSPRGTGTTLDAYTNGGSNILTTWETMATNPPLMYFDSAAAEYKPLIAEALTPNDDMSVWTLSLREGVEFGNGDPLDAAAVIAHLDRHLASDSTSRLRATAAAQIQSYEMVDDMTVEFTLYYPIGNFPATLTVGLGQVDNVAVIEEVGADAYALDNTGGGVGPYEITQFAPPEVTVLEPKQDWWGGPVCFDSIEIHTIPDLSAAYDTYQQGEIDLLSLNRDPVLLNEALEAGDGDATGQVNNGAFFVMPNAGTGGYTGPMTDVRVRQAVAYAIDPEVVNARAWGGMGLASKGLVNDASVLLDGTEGVPYDPDMATQLLDEYKAETGWDGTIEAIAAGQPASNAEAAIAVAAMLDAVGFQTDLAAELGVFDLVTKVAIERDYELVASWGIINSETTLNNGLRSWVSTNPLNQSGFASEAYDQALIGIDGAADLEQYQAALEQMQAVINEEVPFVPYGADPTTTLYNDDIGGLLWHDGITPIVNFAFEES